MAVRKIHIQQKLLLLWIIPRKSAKKIKQLIFRDYGHNSVLVVIKNDQKSFKNKILS